MDDRNQNENKQRPISRILKLRNSECTPEEIERKREYRRGYRASNEYFREYYHKHSDLINTKNKTRQKEKRRENGVVRGPGRPSKVSTSLSISFEGPDQSNGGEMGHEST